MALARGTVVFPLFWVLCVIFLDGGINIYQGNHNRPVIGPCYFAEECSSVDAQNDEDRGNRHRGPLTDDEAGPATFVHGQGSRHVGPTARRNEKRLDSSSWKKLGSVQSRSTRHEALTVMEKSRIVNMFYLSANPAETEVYIYLEECNRESTGQNVDQ